MINNTYSPLEQFELLLPFPFLYSTNLIFFLLLSGLILTFLYVAASYSFFTYLSFFLEKVFNFVANLSKINIKYPEFYMVYFYLFIVVLVNNLVGMIPYSYTTTSSAVVTFFLSIGVFIGISLVGCDYLGYHFLNLFLPSGAPIRILKLLIFIETVSYFIRALSLGVRLFANMVSGHSLLKILSGFAWALLSIKFFFNIFFFLIWMVVGFVTIVETLIAFLQAYVFTFLVSIYLNDSLSGH